MEQISKAKTELRTGARIIGALPGILSTLLFGMVIAGAPCYAASANPTPASRRGIPSPTAAAVRVPSLQACPADGGGFRICIDPGHPSEVGRGTSGRRISEIQAAWQVAQKVKGLLEQHGVLVKLTKDRAEQYVTNRERAETANRFQANLMVRLHCDAEAGSGTATYFPDRQGVSHGFRGPSAEVIAESDQAAHFFHAAMMRSLGGRLRDRGVHSDIETAVGSHQGALTGSIFSHVPVLLVEMCVLTTRKDDVFMSSSDGQWLMARAITDGIRVALGHGHPAF